MMSKRSIERENKKLRRLNKYADLDIENLSDEEYEAIRKKLIRYSSLKLTEGLGIAIIVIFIMFSLKW